MSTITTGGRAPWAFGRVDSDGIACLAGRIRWTDYDRWAPEMESEYCNAHARRPHRFGQRPDEVNRKQPADDVPGDARQERASPRSGRDVPCWAGRYSSRNLVIGLYLSLPMSVAVNQPAGAK